MNFKSLLLVNMLLFFCFVSISCDPNDMNIYDQNDKKVNLNSLDLEYVVLYNMYTCKDCLNDLLQKLQKKDKKFIAIFPSESYNNLGKSVFSQLSESNGVSKNLIYWIESEKFEKLYKDENSPFLLKKEESFIKLSYSQIFDSQGKVKPGVID